jgi:hypothetical protein
LNKRTKLNDRGQAFSYDFLVAFFVFLVLMNIMYLTWNDNVDRIQDIRQFERIRFASSALADNFTLTPGKPSNWEHDIDTNFYGLVGDKYDLVQKKLDALSAKDYDRVKEALNIDEYEFTITVEQDKNTVYTFGQALSQPEYAAGVERVVTYNGKPAKLYLRIYQNQ